MKHTCLLLVLLLLLWGCGAPSPGQGMPPDDDTSPAASVGGEPAFSEPEIAAQDTATDDQPAAARPTDEPVPCRVVRTFILDDGMPEFIAEATGFDDLLTDFTVRNSATGEPIYSMRFTDHLPGGLHTGAFDFDVLDVDFDNYGDLSIFISRGTWNVYRVYAVYDPVTGRYVDDPYGLGELGLPQFDHRAKQVTSMMRGSAVDHWYYIHEYRDGKLVCIEEVAENALQLSGALQDAVIALVPQYDADKALIRERVKRLDETTGELSILGEVFEVHHYESSPPGWTRLGDIYPTESEVGAALKALLREHGLDGDLY